MADEKRRLNDIADVEWNYENYFIIFIRLRSMQNIRIYYLSYDCTYSAIVNSEVLNSYYPSGETL